MSSTAQEKGWKEREQGEEARYARAQEQVQLAALREQMKGGDKGDNKTSQAGGQRRDDIEGGFGGQEDLEDRYATTSGEH